MANDKNESKLVPRLDLNFSDYAIDIFVPSFEFEDEGGKYTKDKIIISFNLKGNLKGLKFNGFLFGTHLFKVLEKVYSPSFVKVYLVILMLRLM